MHSGSALRHFGSKIAPSAHGVVWRVSPGIHAGLTWQSFAGEILNSNMYVHHAPGCMQTTVHTKRDIRNQCLWLVGPLVPVNCFYATAVASIRPLLDCVTLLFGFGLNVYNIVCRGALLCVWATVMTNADLTGWSCLGQKIAENGRPLIGETLNIW